MQDLKLLKSKKYFNLHMTGLYSIEYNPVGWRINGLKIKELPGCVVLLGFLHEFISL